MASIYNAQVLPLISYCLVVWGKGNLKNLSKLQKGSVRAIEGIRSNKHADLHFSKYSMLKAKDIFLQQAQTEGFKR
jgi:hypothetical protein